MTAASFASASVVIVGPLPRAATQGHTSHGMQRVPNLLEKEASEGRSQHRAYDQIVFAIAHLRLVKLPSRIIAVSARPPHPRTRTVGRGRQARAGGPPTGPSFVSSLPPFAPRSGGAGTDSNEMFRNEAIDHAVDTLTP